MTLAPGTRLGPYEIVAPLGAGGMGEVYRARDTRLGREVAVKVLPQHLSSNPEVRARFEREAKTVSSLNHPHICTLFDVGREGETDYLVMELIEGETLAARLARGPLPVTEVPKLGAQIADALDRAHRAGVIHRDLKPGNIMLTKGGAKLMDFGLARATGLVGGARSGNLGSAMTHSPTVAAPLTAEGTIVGTFQYMSPEQLEGKEAGAPADLWALGCALYEMATGRRAFEGRSQASLISAIMSGQPAPLSQSAPASPPALDRLIGRCLAKDPDDRWQSARDLMHELRAMGEPGSAASSPAPAAMPAPRARVAAWRTWLPIVVGVAGVAVAAATWFATHSRRPAPLMLQVPVPADLSLSPFWASFAISPDGQRVAGAAQHGSDLSKLWLWNLGSPAPVELPGTDGPFIVQWSPDSRSVMFLSQALKGLYRVPVSGGSPTRICEALDGRGASWGSKDIILIAPAASGPLYRVEASGGTLEPVTELDKSRGEAGHRFPCFLPDGEHFLFVSLPRGPQGFAVHVGSLGSKVRRQIMEADGAPVYVEPGYLLFRKDGKVMAQRFDTGRLALVGGRIPLADAPPPSDLDAEPIASASRDGRLMFPWVTHPHARLEWLDRKGASLAALPLPEGNWELLALSPDQRVAAATRDQDLWRVDLERSVATRLARSVTSEQKAVWSPDGRRLALSLAPGRAVLDILHAGSGVVDSVPSVQALFQDVQDWTPDGRALVVAVLGRAAESGPTTSWDIWTVPLDGSAPTPYLATPGLERFARVSPDGRWMLCQSTVDGQVELFIDSYPVPGRRAQILTGTPDAVLRMTWGRGGREVLYTEAGGDMVSVPVEPVGDEIRLGRPTRLFAVPEGVGATRTRDGERFLVTRQTGRAPGPTLRLILDWPALVDR